MIEYIRLVLQVAAALLTGAMFLVAFCFIAFSFEDDRKRIAVLLALLVGLIYFVMG